MKAGLTAATAAFLLLWAAVPVAFAHRLDEFLQATTITLGKDRVVVQMYLTPGVGVFGTVLADIDTDRDGVLCEAEQRAYAGRVRRDLSLAVDGNRLPLRLVSATFPEIGEMREGLGDILLRFEADVPPGGPERRLVFENHYQSGLAAYLVNGLFPNDPDLRVTAQSRNFDQSSYQLNYTQAGVRPGPPPTATAPRPL